MQLLQLTTMQQLLSSWFCFVCTCDEGNAFRFQQTSLFSLLIAV
jgi:hypothetical protein